MGLDKFLSDLLKTSSTVRASNIARGNRRCFLESATIWHQIDVARPSIMIPVSPSVGTVYYTNDSPYPDAQVHGVTALNGVCYFLAPGAWYVMILPAGSAPVMVCFDVFDIGDQVNALPFMMNAAGAGLLPVNVARWGNVVQTGANIGAYYQTLTHGPLLGTVDAAHVVQGRESEWVSARGGRRFYMSLPPGSTLTAPAAFNPLTPTLLISSAALATRTCIVRSLYIDHVTDCVDPTEVAVILDTIDRYTPASGVARVPTNTNTASATVWPITNAYEVPTAVAASAPRYVFRGSVLQGKGQHLAIGFDDGIILFGASQSILVYAYDAAGANPRNIRYGLDMEAY